MLSAELFDPNNVIREVETADVDVTLSDLSVEKENAG